MTREHAAAHLDWMFEIDGVLQTWATEWIPDLDRPIQTRALRLPDHRLHYLDYEGEISGQRGTVSRVLSGTLATIQSSPDRLVATVTYHRGPASRTRNLELQRNCTSNFLSDETRDAWDLRFA